MTGNVASLSILSVVKGQSVTIQAANYPANLEFRVLMDKIGTRAVGGVRAGTAKTDKDGSFKATFGVPASLKDQNLIAIRIEVTGSSGHFAYNWFQNSTSTINPDSGTRSPVNKWANVDLPLPDGPSRSRRSPSRMCSEQPRSTGSPPEVGISHSAR